MPSMMSTSSAASDRSYLALVRREAWVNPEPAPRYDLVVIGGGTAGLVAAAGAAGLGARVALVERHRLGGDVFFGDARFEGPDRAVVAGTRLRFRSAVIATGTRPRLPPVPGLAEAAPLTSDTVFDLDEAPRRLAILGGGPMGCELAQAFQRLGVQFSLLHDQTSACPGS